MPFETDPGHLANLRPLTDGPGWEKRPEVIAATSRLKAMPLEALEVALRLTLKGDESIRDYRWRAAAFMAAMHYTHAVPPELHRRISRRLFNELIRPQAERGEDNDAITIIAVYFAYCGSKEDMEMLSPLTEHPKAAMRRFSMSAVSSIAQSAGLPRPDFPLRNYSDETWPGEFYLAKMPEPESPPIPQPDARITATPSPDRTPASIHKSSSIESSDLRPAIISIAACVAVLAGITVWLWRGQHRH